MGFSRQEYWSGLPFPPPGDLPDLGEQSHLRAVCLRSPLLWARYGRQEENLEQGKEEKDQDERQEQAIEDIGKG